MELKVKRLSPSAELPTQAHEGEGWDLYSSRDIFLHPNKTTLVPTGICLGFPDGYFGEIRDRSGMATKQNLQVVAGILDNLYIGEDFFAFYSPEGNHIEKGQKIAQLLLRKIENVEILEVDNLDNTARGNSGFGSSDEK